MLNEQQKLGSGGWGGKEAEAGKEEVSFHGSQGCCP